jgi:hypothetical protein
METTRRSIILEVLQVIMKIIGRCPQKTSLHKDCPRTSTNCILTSFMISCIVDRVSILYIHEISWIQKMTSNMHNLAYKNLHHMTTTLTSMKKYTCVPNMPLRQLDLFSHLILIPSYTMDRHYRKYIVR